MINLLKKFFSIRRLIFATIAVVATELSVFDIWPTPIDQLLELISFPAVMFAALIAALTSGNVHGPNEIIANSTLFLIYLIIAVGLEGIWGLARRRIRRKGTGF